MNFGTKMDVRKTCKVCDKPLTKFQRTFCCYKHSQQYHTEKNREKSVAYHLAKYDEAASIPSDDKIQCLLCGKWYVQIGGHVFQRHNMTAREYKEMMKLEVKRGVVPLWYRKLKGDIAIENETYKNIIESGRKFRFKKGQKGIGNYERSPITIARLRKNWKRVSELAPTRIKGKGKKI